MYTLVLFPRSFLHLLHHWHTNIYVLEHLENLKKFLILLTKKK